MKSSELLTNELSEQATATVVTLPPATVPAPLETLQFWPVGLLFTVTLYAAAVGQLRGEGERAVRAHAQVITAVVLQHHRPREARDGPAHRVERVATQFTATFVTLAPETVPDPFDTVHVWPDGLLFTVTLYALPSASFVAKPKIPFALRVRSSPPLSCSTTVPDRPDTVPPTE